MASRYNSTRSVASRLCVGVQLANVANDVAKEREQLARALHSRWEARQDGARCASLVTDDGAFSPEDFPGEYEGRCW